jgi:hypothetical protein
MIWLPAWLNRALAWLLGGLAIIAGAFYAGKREARRKAENEALRGYVDTRRAIDDAPIITDANDALERLRNRGDKP